MPNLCNLDGVILPEQQATVPVLDRGFLFGDSIYEVFATRNGVPFAIQGHLQRLRTSASALRLNLDLDDTQLLTRIKSTVTAAGFAESYIRLIVSRGTALAPNIDIAQSSGSPRYVILVRGLESPVRRPLRLAVISRLRNDRRALDPATKSGNYLNNVLGLAEAKQSGADDALFLNASGQITEASTSNVFLVRKGSLATPTLQSGILAGITRQLAMAGCREAGLPVHEGSIDARALQDAEEVFLTSTLRGVAPVVALDERVIGTGSVGPVTSKVMELFERTCVRQHAADCDLYAKA